MQKLLSAVSRGTIVLICDRELVVLKELKRLQLTAAAPWARAAEVEARFDAWAEGAAGDGWEGGGGGRAAVDASLSAGWAAVLDPAAALPPPPAWAPHAAPAALLLAAAGRPLSARELECLTLAARGATSRAIADKLGISERTVNAHIERAIRKCGAKNRQEAVARAISDGIIPF
jgi:DNA-binding CsgD family transcriptional regulator